MKVLVPIDGSRSSIRALEYVALRTRRGQRLSVHILYVQPPTMPAKLLNKMTFAEWQGEDQARVLTNVKIKTLKKGLKAKLSVRSGDPAVVVQAFAKEHKCSEIVMGTRGLGPVKGLLLGSTTMKVVQLVSMPVTLVK